MMKQLIINPSMEIRDISAATSISHKTIRRRLDKMIINYVLEFSIQPNPDAMKGYIVFFLDVKLKNRRGSSSHYYPKVLLRIYDELHERFMVLSSDISNQEDRIGCLLGSEDTFEIESIRSRIELFDEVEEASVFLPIKLACPQEWIIKAIDRRLSNSTKIGT
jgi:DNA-binding Lrp family transcriptional regulator